MSKFDTVAFPNDYHRVPGNSKNGLSIRDYLAGKILSGILSNRYTSLDLSQAEDPSSTYIARLTKAAYKVVDEMEKQSNG
jgi:hypothetical protein